MKAWIISLAIISFFLPRVIVARAMYHREQKERKDAAIPPGHRNYRHHTDWKEMR